MKRRIFIISSWLMVIHLFFISACGGQGAQTTRLEQINVACFPNITHAQALLMKGQGTLEQAFGQETAINWITFNAGPAEIEALFAGEIDLGFIGPVPAVSGYIQSAGDLYVIAGAANGGSVLVAGNHTDIREAADLDGKTVAIPQFGNTQHLSLLALLSAHGLKPSASGGTVDVVQSSNADIANLMSQGNIDAALVPEPWGSILELNADARLVLDYNQIDPNGIPSTTVVIVRKDFLDSWPEAVAQFIEAHQEATDYLNRNQEDAMRIINEQLTEITQQPITEDVLRSSFRRLEFSSGLPEESIMDFAKTGMEENLITEMPDSNFINDAFIK